MNKPYILKPHFCRFSRFYEPDSPEVPAELLTAEARLPELSDFPLPLPSKKSDYCCMAQAQDGALWYGASTGLTRYDAKAERAEDRVLYFSAQRDLPDNCVKSLYAADGGMWVRTESGVAFIELKDIGAQEKADILLAETLKYVDRRGMVSQRDLKKKGDISTAVPYGHSDNDGCFTAGFAIGEVFRYAVFKREKGLDAPETIKAKAVATRAVEACLLLMHIHGRGNGFVARTYLCPDEPVPDDGFFFRKADGKAVCLETTFSKKRGFNGMTIDAAAPVPERLAHLYKDLGYDGEGIVYKADTSSDEITLHFLQMWLAHELLGEDDKELDEIIKQSAIGLMTHIIDNGFALVDCTGEPTTWARWNESYFNSDFGWVDACLNAAEVLMYLKVTMAITGEQGRWRDTYDMLVEKGYADLTTGHFDRMYQASLSMGCNYVEDIMYGDHMLAVASFYALCVLEKDEKLLEKYRKGFESWRSSIAREYNPGYDFPFAVACPDAELDMERIASWFYRTNASRLASGVSLVGRHDVPVIAHPAGYRESAWVMAPDECFISKYDRNPLEYKDSDSGGAGCVESCYVYTLAYWMGRYYGFIG